MSGINPPPNSNIVGGRAAASSASSSETPAGPCLNPTPRQLQEWLNLPQGTQDPQFPQGFPVRDGNGREYDAWVWEFDNATGERRWTGQFLSDPTPYRGAWDPSWTVMRVVDPEPAEPVETEVERSIITCLAHGRYYCSPCFRSQSGYYARCILIAMRYHNPSTCPICPNH